MSFTPPGEEPPAPPSPPPPAPPIPGWWLASDGNWYPPQQQPGVAPPPPPPGGPSPYGAPPPTGPPMYAPAPGYGYTPYAPSRGTNPFAIASLVCGIVWFWWIGSVLAIVFGFVAQNQIKQTNQGGRGLATAGLILGFIGIGILVIAIIAIALGGNAQVKFSSVSNSIN